MKLRIANCELRNQPRQSAGRLAVHSSFEIRRSKFSSGFTLIELILILALLVVITSLAAPAMANFIRSRALDSESRRLFALMHVAQSRAVSEGMPIMLWVDQKNSEYGVSEEMAGKPGSKNSDPQAEELPLDSTLQIAVANLGAGTPTTFNNLPAIKFLPDGTVDENSPQTVQLADSAGFMRWLLLNKTRTSYEISNVKPN